jgi:hypothetical protein
MLKNPINSSKYGIIKSKEEKLEEYNNCLEQLKTFVLKPEQREKALIDFEKKFKELRPNYQPLLDRYRLLNRPKQKSQMPVDFIKESRRAFKMIIRYHKDNDIYAWSNAFINHYAIPLAEKLKKVDLTQFEYFSIKFEQILKKNKHRYNKKTLIEYFNIEENYCFLKIKGRPEDSYSLEKMDEIMDLLSKKENVNSFLIDNKKYICFLIAYGKLKNDSLLIKNSAELYYSLDQLENSFLMD